MQSTINLDALRAFTRVVQAGSFTRAAQTLQTHKAQLSRVIGQLERELGVRLLERTTRSLSLTEIGREFHAHSLSILAAVDDATNAVASSRAEPTGTLRLTCGVEFGMLAVSGWISAYLARYPQMKVEAEITGRIVDVVHEGFDLAIRVGTLPDSTLTARRLGSLRYGLYAAPEHVGRHGVPLAPEELASHELLAFAPGGGAPAWQLTQGERTVRLQPNARFRASNSFTVRDAAAAGLGIALLPDRVAEPLLRDGRLCRILPGWSPPEVPVNAVFPSARYLAPKVRAFIDLALNAFADPPGTA